MLRAPLDHLWTQLTTKRGLVTVRVNHPLAECVKLAEQLRARFNLSLCEVAPLRGTWEGSPVGPIAAVGSAVFERYLSNPQVKMLGMGAGITLRAVIDERFSNGSNHSL